MHTYMRGRPIWGMSLDVWMHIVRGTFQERGSESTSYRSSQQYATDQMRLWPHELAMALIPVLTAYVTDVMRQDSNIMSWQWP